MAVWLTLREKNCYGRAENRKGGFRNELCRTFNDPAQTEGLVPGGAGQPDQRDPADSVQVGDGPEHSGAGKADGACEAVPHIHRPAGGPGGDGGDWFLFSASQQGRYEVRGRIL